MLRQAFEDHAVWKTLDNIEGLFEKAEGRNDPAAADALDQIRYLIAELGSHRQPADAAPYSAVTLQALNGHLANLGNELNNYGSNGNPAHLTNGLSHVDQLVHTMGLLPVSHPKGGAAAAAKRAYEAYRADATKTIKLLTDSNAELRSRLNEQKDELTQLGAKIKQDEARLDQALTTHSEAFTTKQAERQERFSQWLEEEAEKLDSRAMSDITQVVNIRKRSETHLKEIQRLQADVEKVSSKAAAGILAKDYGTYSTREWVSGVVAYVLGFALLVALAIYLVVTVSGVGRGELVTWQYVALKLGLTLSAIAASGVAFQFGGHALTRASTNKRVQLELATIGTFLADVDDEEAVHRAKVQFVERMFGRAWEDKSTTHSNGTESSEMASLVKVLELINKQQSGSV